MFSLSRMHQAPRQVKYIKRYQNYYTKLRSNIGVGVPIDQILTTYMYVPGIEKTHASCKDANVLIFLYSETELFQSTARWQC